MKSKLRVAIADDDSFIRRYFQEILPDLGHEVVVVAENGRQLVEECISACPDLVISDIKMDEMDGIEAARAILCQLPVPVILVSAFHDPDLLERAEASLVMGYLVKPIEKPQLDSMIRIAMRRFEQIDELQHEVVGLRQSLEDRKTIEKGKGVLMRLSGMGEAEAYRRMQQIACEQNTKLVEVARRLIAAGPIIDAAGSK